MLNRNSVRRCLPTGSCPGCRRARATRRSRSPRGSVVGGCGAARATSSRIRVIETAPTRPATWVFAPACSATAVRDPLVLTANPWNRPADTFAAPIPIISWFPSTRLPDRPAKTDAVEIVSTSATSAMPNAPGISCIASEKETSGIVNGGNPCGSVPTTETPRSARSKAVNGSDRAGRRRPGRRGSSGAATAGPGSATRDPSPIHAAAATTEPSTTPSTKATVSSMRPSASMENPNSLGN